MRTYSTKLILNEEQHQSIMDVLVLEREVWNFISSMVFKNKTILSLKTIHKEFTTYKAQQSGKKVVTVNPAYTSQIDFRTGNKDGQRQKGRYVGADGKVLNADINASLNIAKRSKLPVSCNSVVIYGQGAINHPYFCKSTNPLVV